MKSTKPVAMTVAGSDPSGGAGIQADLKTFHQFGLYGTSVITLLTVQDTRELQEMRVLDPGFVMAQLDSLIADLPPRAAKTGALGSPEIIEALASKAARFPFPLVVDPVLTGTCGVPLVVKDGAAAFQRGLLKHAYLVTPNLPEAEALTGIRVDSLDSMREAARAIAALGPRAVLLKGGHLEGESATDLLYFEGEFQEFRARRIAAKPLHGTGCTFSAAITAGLAQGKDLLEAVAAAKQYITRAIETGPRLGRGPGPVNHHAES